jgi:hypothetical protein
MAVGEPPHRLRGRRFSIGVLSGRNGFLLACRGQDQQRNSRRDNPTRSFHIGPPLPYHMRPFTHPSTNTDVRRASTARCVKSKKSQVPQVTFSKCNPQEPLAAEAAWLPPWLWLAICAICAFMRFLISAGVGSSLCVAIIQE